MEKAKGEERKMKTRDKSNYAHGEQTIKKNKCEKGFDNMSKQGLGFGIYVSFQIHIRHK